jgi:tetratricopeptide (TPR) repeat protein
MTTLLLSKYFKNIYKMKNTLVLLFSLLVTLSFSQKKELRSANKKFDSGDVNGADEILKSNLQLFESADDKIFSNYILLRAKISRSKENFELAIEQYKSIESNKNFSKEVKSEIDLLLNDIVTSAITDNKQESYLDAAKKLFLAYKINIENKDYLYYAASSAVNAAEYEMALDLYLQLKNINYQGIATKYYVTITESGEKTEVDAIQFEFYKKTPKEYTDFIEEQTPSKFPEIVKNIALIYNQLGLKDDAIAAVAEARKSNPDDVNLILVEANLYIELDEKDKFKELIAEAIILKPDDPILFFNLGVVNSDQGNDSEARTYYRKAIEIDPKYESAYLNLVALILKQEPIIVEEMNSLGTSKSDDKKYDLLKKKREDLYLECVPILKSLIELTKDEEAVKTLMNIYGTIGDNDGFNTMKALIE